MKTMTAIEFRRNLPSILKGSKNQDEIQITYRGKLAGKFSPPEEASAPIEERDALFVVLDELAAMADPNEPMHEPLTNEEIDRLIYGI
jgi:hypothetical protein